MPYYQTLRKPYSNFIEYLQILSGGKIDDVKHLQVAAIKRPIINKSKSSY